MPSSISAQSCDSGAAGAGMDGEDRVLPVVLAAEHLLDLAGLHFLVERVERLDRIRVSTASPASAHSTSTARSSLFRSDA
jgi:hypothetical protein